MQVKTEVGTVGTKGQVTIPQAIRERLGLRPGDQLEFVCEGDKTVIRPCRRHKNPFEKYVGIFPAFKTEEEIVAWISELREEE